MNLSWHLTLRVAVAAILAACAAMPPATDSPGLDGSSWVLVSLASNPPVAKSAVTLQFEGGRVQGSDGCNRYTAPYTATSSTLQVGPRVASTQMACPAALTVQASALMGALTRAHAYRIADRRLQLLGADNAVLAAFAAQSTSLAGTAWRVTGYNNGKQAVVSALAGTNLTMAFAADGKVSGSAGCNGYTGPYTLEGRNLALGRTAATRLMCARPEGVMEQEQQFLKALETVANARFEGARLELRTAEGALAVTLTKASPR
jgi:heat shock protein HslJ